MAEILEGGTDSLYHRYVYYDKDWKQCEKKDMAYWLEVSEIDAKQKEAETKSAENSDIKKDKDCCIFRKGSRKSTERRNLSSESEHLCTTG